MSTTVWVNPIPTVTILQAEYVMDIKMLKIEATTTFTNSIMTYGTDPNGAPIGTMQFEQGRYKGAIVMDSAPAYATVWNSMGGDATVSVTVKTGTGGNSSTDPEPDSTDASATYRLAIATVGKGSVSVSPSGKEFTAGTVVTLTATPERGAPWIGWSGDASGTSRTTTVTIKRDMKVYANFK